MRKLSTFICLVFLFNIASAQDKKDLSLSFSAGFFNSPYYKRAHTGGFYKFGAGYHLSKNHALSFEFLGGRHTYYDDILSDKNAAESMIGIHNNTNSFTLYTVFSISYKYKVINKNKFSLVPGVGAGIMTHSQKYPSSMYNGGITMVTTSFSDLVFPVSLDINYEILKNFQIGVTSGFLIHPDFPVLGLHIGPKISYVLK